MELHSLYSLGNGMEDLNCAAEYNRLGAVALHIGIQKYLPWEITNQ